MRMRNERGSRQVPPEHSLRSAVAVLCGIFALTLSASAWAQYTYRPPESDEHGETIRYFGSSKDDKGVLLPVVTVEISAAQSTFVFVTDEMGRFHGHLPLSSAADKLSLKC